MKKLLVMPMLLLASVAHAAWEETVPAPSGDDTVMINNLASPPGDTSQFTAFKNFPVSTPAQSALDDKEPLKGANDNYVTDAEKTAIGNLSGTNTGDQNLSGFAEKSNVLELNNTSAFTPDQAYEPATKAYADTKAPALTANENYVTDVEKSILSNTSGNNTGDQNLSGLAEKANVLELDNTDVFTPDADYEPATKKYVDDNGGSTVDLVQTVRNTSDGGLTTSAPSEAAVGDALEEYTTLEEVQGANLVLTGSVDATGVSAFATGLITLGHEGQEFKHTLSPTAAPYTNNWSTEFGDYNGRVPNINSVDTDGNLILSGSDITGTVSLGTSSIADGTCTTAVTDTATGATSADVITWVFASDPSSVTGYDPSGDLVYIMDYPSTDAVNFRVCNKSGNPVTPGAITLNYRVPK